VIKHFEHTTRSNHKIRVWDGLLNYQQQSKLMNLVYKMPFGFNGGYDGIMHEQKSKVCCKGLISNDWLKKYNFIPSNHVGAIRFSDISPFFSLDTDSAKPVAELLANRVMVRAWINAGTPMDLNLTHVDSNHPGALILFQYINLKWDKNWDGFTVFRDLENQDLEFVSDFVPGRVIVFDGDIPHKAAAQSHDAPTFRFTANSMWVLEEDYLKHVNK
jgi:hypothetical protein